ncbi:MAG TPA: flagellar basal body-associated FliL family protein [Oscillatoriaceae cyanobacterium]
MATNLKKTPEKKEEKAAKAETKGVQFDLKWLLAGLGLVAITMGSVIIGIQLAPPKQVVVVKKQLVQKLPPKPGLTENIFSGAVVNLLGGHYLRFSVDLQFAADDKVFPPAEGGEKKKAADPLAAWLPMIKDTIVSEASRHASDDLLTPAGKDHLKAEIQDALNKQFDGMKTDPDTPEPEVIHVYFTDFVIQ